VGASPPAYWFLEPMAKPIGYPGYLWTKNGGKE
jgi:hypothetical protein